MSSGRYTDFVRFLAARLVKGCVVLFAIAVLNFFLDYATPGYTQEGPTAAVYNHGWVVGDESAVSVSAQAEMDTLLEAVPQK